MTNPDKVPNWNEADTDGTTIISMKYDGGIMLAADGRSASFYVANYCSDKLEPIH
jgi:20S proteasome alpha/beta subunit